MVLFSFLLRGTKDAEPWALEEAGEGKGKATKVSGRMLCTSSQHSLGRPLPLPSRQEKLPSSLQMQPRSLQKLKKVLESAYSSRRASR